MFWLDVALGDVGLPLNKVETLIGLVEESLKAVGEREGDKRVDPTRTRLYLSVVPTLLEHGEIEQAQKYADQSLVLAQDFVARFPEGDVYLAWLTSAWSNVGKAREKNDDIAGAIEAWERAREISARNLTRPDKDGRAMRAHVRSLEALAKLYDVVNDAAKADRAFADAVALQERLIASTDAPDIDQRRLGDLLEQMVQRRDAPGSLLEALALYERVLAAFRKQAGDDVSPYDAIDPGRVLISIARISCGIEGQLARCEEAIAEAKEHLETAEALEERERPGFDNAKNELAEIEQEFKARKK